MLPLQRKTRKGALSEWLGAGLQNRLRRFESARHLRSIENIFDAFFVISLRVLHGVIRYFFVQGDFFHKGIAVRCIVYPATIMG